MTLALHTASVRVRSATLVDGVSWTFRPGRLTAILGPNGAGKSTVLRLLSGEMSPTSGRATLDRRPLSGWPPEEVARRRAVVPQSTRPVPLRVHEAVALGRAPHRRGSSAAEDAATVADALEAVGLTALADRSVASLSGGERQRAALARALAQLPPPAQRGTAHLLLDEPTAALDPAHQHAVMTIARTVAEQGATVIAVLHDINLALHYADDALLLRGGRSISAGAAGDVLTAATLARTYDCSVEFIPRQGAGLPPIAITGR